MSAFLQAVIPSLEIPVPGKTAEELRAQLLELQAQEAAQQEQPPSEENGESQ